MIDQLDVNEMTNQGIYMEVCGRNKCNDCPLTNIPGPCAILPRNVLLNAYFSLWGKNFKITEKEWESLIEL